jgi:two-component system sensor histidine kinase AlgZ
MQTRLRYLLSLRYLSTLAVACIVMGALPGFLAATFGNLSLRAFLGWTVRGCVYAGCIAVPCGLTLPAVARAMDERPAFQQVPVLIGLLAAFSVAGCLLANVILVSSGLVHGRYFWPEYWRSLKMSLLIAVTFGLLTTAFMTLQGRLAAAKTELHNRQIAEERERKIAAEARYASLESRVHPHFLFNTLNSISALVRENPAEAERMIERLSALLRYSLDSDVAGLVPLREELRVVGEYLGIEQVRFGLRLRYRIEAAENAGERMVPALSVQTLVENSVKYAVGASRQGAEIVISAALHDGVLRVTVSDDGPGFAPADCVKPGHGLDLLKRRLESLFGESAALEMNAANGRTQVGISVAA